MDTYLSKINMYFKYDDYLTIADAKRVGIGRHILSKYAREHILERVKRGVYALPNNVNDNFVLLQMKNKKIIYSYGSALYFHHLSDRVPNGMDVSVPQGYNASHMKDFPIKIYVHYVKKEFYHLGIERIKSTLGGDVYVYDKERCICDLIKHKKHIDMQLFQSAVKGYFELKERDLNKLYMYSKVLGIEAQVKEYIMMLE